jgi:hypothetical protein
MVNIVRKRAMRKYHELVHHKKYMEQAPKRYPSLYRWMSEEEYRHEEEEYKITCEKIEMLKEILDIK